MTSLPNHENDCISFFREDIDAERGGDAGAAAGSAPEPVLVAETGDVAPTNDVEPPRAAEPPPAPRGWSRRRIGQNGRRFNIELAPKVFNHFPLLFFGENNHLKFVFVFGSMSGHLFQRKPRRSFNSIKRQPIP